MYLASRIDSSMEDITQPSQILFRDPSRIVDTENERSIDDFAEENGTESEQAPRQQHDEHDDKGGGLDIRPLDLEIRIRSGSKHGAWHRSLGGLGLAPVLYGARAEGWSWVGFPFWEAPFDAW